MGREGKGGEVWGSRASHSAYPHFISWRRLCFLCLLSSSSGVTRPRQPQQPQGAEMGINLGAQDDEQEFNSKLSIIMINFGKNVTSI